MGVLGSEKFEVRSVKGGGSEKFEVRRGKGEGLGRRGVWGFEI
jgi:hypothetical protein